MKSKTDFDLLVQEVIRLMEEMHLEQYVAWIQIKNKYRLTESEANTLNNILEEELMLAQSER